MGRINKKTILIMKWLKHENRRVNLENVVYFESVDFKRREENGEVKAIFAIRFVYSTPRDEVNFEFFKFEERENFIKSIDDSLFSQMV